MIRFFADAKYDFIAHRRQAYIVTAVLFVGVSAALAANVVA